MPTCAICYEEMDDTVEFDAATTETQVDGDCTRLGCGHALHTRCMVDALQATGGKCPLCTQRQNPDKFYDEYMRVCLRTLETLRKTPRIAEGLKDYAGFHRELCAKYKTFRQRVRDFKKALRQEMQIEKLQREITDIRAETRRRVRSQLVFEDSISNYTLDKWLFKSQYSAWDLQRVFYRD